jgi:hypothetical protein
MYNKQKIIKILSQFLLIIAINPIFTLLFVGIVNGTPVPDYFNENISESNHPIYLDRTSDSYIPVMRYSRENLPQLIKKDIDHIDFQISNMSWSNVMVYFSENPGLVNISISRITSEFIVSRPEWIGNRSAESLTAQIFLNWAEDTMKTHRFFKYFYPSYISIIKGGVPGSIHPTYLSYWYLIKSKPVIRYSEYNIPADISKYVDAIEFQASKETDDQVMIYMHPDINVVSLTASIKIADFIMRSPHWIGDRSRISVITEIYLHWFADNIGVAFKRQIILNTIYTFFVIGSEDNRTSPIYPIHLGYYYRGLNKTPVMDPFLQRI